MSSIIESTSRSDRKKLYNQYGKKNVLQDLVLLVHTICRKKFLCSYAKSFWLYWLWLRRQMFCRRIIQNFLLNLTMWFRLCSFSLDSTDPGSQVRNISNLNWISFRKHQNYIIRTFLDNEIIYRQAGNMVTYNVQTDETARFLDQAVLVSLRLRYAL